MSYRFQGSDKVETSTVNHEVVPAKPEGWTFGFSFRNFTFLNEQDCTVKINGGKSIFIRANQGLRITSKTSEPVRSFVINEEGIPFTWIGSL